MPTFFYIHSILQFTGTHYTSNSMWQIFTTIKGYVLGTWNKQILKDLLTVMYICDTFDRANRDVFSHAGIKAGFLLFY